MKRLPVNSTNILSIGYDEESQILEIEFNTKRIYRYSNVPPHIYSALMKSSSHGKYFLKHIANSYSSIEVA
jgi:KTSC domain